MIAATSFALGISVSGLRSLFGYAFGSFLLLVMLGSAALYSFTAAAILDLFITIAGFNLGIGASTAALGTIGILRRQLVRI